MLNRDRLQRDWLRRCRLDLALGGIEPVDPARVVSCVVDVLTGADPDDRLTRYAESGAGAAQILGQLEHLASALSRRVVDDEPTLSFRSYRQPSACSRALRYPSQSSRRSKLLDPLTGLGNRRRFDIELARILGDVPETKGSPPLVALLDLDGLKRVNDKDGHSAGDALITDFARILAKELPLAGQRYRWGGDEFALITETTEGTVERELSALQIRTSVPAFSWGLAVYGPDGENAAEIVDAADSRLYGQKLSRKASLAELRRAADRTVQIGIALVRRQLDQGPTPGP